MAEFETWDALIDRVAVQVHQGILAPNVGTALASLAGAKVKLYETSIKLWEASDAKEKLEELEGKVEELKSSAGARNGHRVGARNGF